MFICAQVSYSKKKAGDGKPLVRIPRGDFRLLPRMRGTEEDIFLAAAAAGSHSSSRLTFPGKKYPPDINNALLRTERDFSARLCSFPQTLLHSTLSPPLFFSPSGAVTLRNGGKEAAAIGRHKKRERGGLLAPPCSLGRSVSR